MQDHCPDSSKLMTYVVVCVVEGPLGEGEVAPLSVEREVGQVELAGEVPADDGRPWQHHPAAQHYLLVVAQEVHAAQFSHI